METLVVVAQHRNQYCSRSKSHVSDRFGSSPSKGFRGINCRTFQSGAGILPPPTSPLTYSPREPKSPCFYSEPPKRSKGSQPIPINSPKSPKRAIFADDLSYSELWAGPAYSNSPPPSSLPMPKFSIRQKRTVSLELYLPKSEIMLHQVAKSAPASPRESSPSTNDFFLNTATATENLRRILHLDISDD